MAVSAPSLLTIPLELFTMIAEATVERAKPCVRLGCLSNSKDNLQNVLQLAQTCKSLEVACAPTLMKRVVLTTLTSTGNLLLALCRKPYLVQLVQTLVITKDCCYVSDRAEAESWNKDYSKQMALAPIIIGVHPEMALSFVLSVLLMMRILQVLPTLSALAVPLVPFANLQRWPQHLRMCGQSILHLRVTGESKFFESPLPPCKTMSSWLYAFRPGQSPSDLKTLELCHEKSDSCQHSRKLSKWAKHVASLTELSLLATPFEDLSDFLKPCTRLTSLRVDHTSLSLANILDAILASDLLQETLQSLSIAVRLPQHAAGITAEGLFDRLARFTKLRLAAMPMPFGGSTVISPSADLQNLVAPLASLQILQKLEVFRLEWTVGETDEESSYGNHPFMQTLVLTIVAHDKLPALKSVVMQWPRKHFAVGRDGAFDFVFDALGREGVENTAAGLVLMQKLLAAKGISLRHCLGDDVQTLDNQEWIARLQRTSINTENVFRQMMARVAEDGFVDGESSVYHYDVETQSITGRVVGGNVVPLPP